MEFCPMCGSMLMLELPNSSHDKFHPTRFYCLTCPYICSIEKEVCYVMYSSSIFHFYYQPVTFNSTHFIMFSFTLQVKIKRRQMLVRKGIDPIISHHEINKNKPKADGTTFLLLFSQQFLSIILL
jgi:hypothetical protein